MKKGFIVFMSIMFAYAPLSSQEVKSQSDFPVMGFCIGIPHTSEIDRFISFIHDELVPRNINTLILRVDYDYQYQSHPELANKEALKGSEIKRIVKECQKYNILLVPQIDLLGHQSWAGEVNNLLKVYPDFDETPYIKMPSEYKWPNEDGLYCKSYCPLHPRVHEVIFELVDEICEAFETKVFHAGMDEVFYIGHDSCQRCSGYDKSELYAREVNLIHDHLAESGRQLWIWGDRLIDGKTTGIGMWEASMNNTYKAVDLIPKDVFICDWHYERPDPTAVYFALKGFSVAACPWNNPEAGIKQKEDMIRFRLNATEEMKDRYAGMIQTVWSSVSQFLDEFSDPEKEKNTAAGCFKAIFPK